MKKENIVYLSNEGVQLIVGCNDHKDMVKINEYKSYPFAEGAIINGVITDEFEIKSILKQLASENYREVSLVIDSSQILSKNLTVPKMKEKQLLKVIQDELSSIGENSEDLIYDYAYLGPSAEGRGASQILCCGVERKLISNYLEVFSECGITIKAIDFSINILGSVIKDIVKSNMNSFLISMIDGNNLTSVLFENNCYKLSYRSRIVSPRDTTMFEQEVIMNISNIFQFSKSGENSVPIKGVYFCGLHDEEANLLNRIKENLFLEAETLTKPSSIYVINEASKEQFELDRFILPVGYLLKK